MLSIRRGEGGYARLRLESEATVTRGDRFVLRSYSPSVTLAGGRIADPAAPAGGVRLEPTIQRFATLLAPLRGQDKTEIDAQALMVAEAGAQGLAADALSWRMRVAPDDVTRTIRTLAESGRAIDVGGRLVDPVWRTRLTERVLAALDAHHAAEPLSEGISREEVRERVLGIAAPGLAELVIHDLMKAGRIRGSDRLSIAGRDVALTTEEVRVRDAIDQALRSAFLQPLESARLAEVAASTPSAVEKMLQLLVRQKIIVRLGGMPFHRDSLEQLKSEIRGLKEKVDAGISVATFKDRYGLSRKHAIPLLEYLDRERVTRRVGDSRVLM